MIYGLIVFLLAVMVAPASARTITCIGEPGSGRAIGGRQASTSAFADSAVGDCLFFSDSQIGQRINSVCHIGEIGGDDPGSLCRVEAEVIRKGRPGFNVIKRVIKVERISTP
jgi:hypothetical protein